ncbi:MAG: peptide deformylase [Chlamydiales bacterium]
MILELRYFGDPILRQKAKPVEKITEEIRDLAQNMVESMLHYNGIGLAAPQVGRLLRLFVSNVDHEDEEGEIHLGAPKIFINPKLSHPSQTMVERSEGCLSIPKLYAPVNRPLSVEIEAMDIEGNLFKQEFYGYVARVIMHENDHLNGVLFVDRIKGKKHTELEPILRQIKQRYYKKKT